MASLSTKVRKYLEANGKSSSEIGAEGANVQLVNEGSGDIIKVWTVSGLAKPTDDQLKAKESDADKLEKNATAIDNRKAEYGTVEQQLEYITENGLTKWQENVAAIKKKYPKE